MKPIEYKSSKYIIAEVFRRLKPTRSDFVIDALEWIGDALDAIGTASQLEPAVKIVQTFNHRTKVPQHTASIQSIYYTKFDLTDDTTTPTREDFKYELPYGSTEGHPAFVPEDTDHPTGVDRTEYGESWLYTPGYIRTSFDSDWIMINYRKIATDNDGFPLIPYNYEFKQALYWYIVMMMMESGMKHAVISYEKAEYNWLRYCTQARNIMNMPTPAEMEAFRDSWVGLLPEKVYELEESIDADGVDADNLIVDIFQRYTIAP